MQSTQYTSSSSTFAPTVQKVLLPTQIIEKPAAVHEEIRNERVEEIQPVVNVEKLKTEVHQVTQPLFDKEVRPVAIEQRTLATEILPEVFVAGRGVNTADDVSTTQYLDTTTVVVEKPAQFMEVERTQIIEEIQPVIYKETVVPHVIKETKPVYQKIVEGPVYTQETLPARSLRDTNYSLPVSAPTPAPFVERAVEVPAAPMAMDIPIVDETPMAASLPVGNLPRGTLDSHRREIVEDTTTVTTTTTIAPVLGANMGAHDPLLNSGNAATTKQHKGLSGLFHKQSKTDVNNNGGVRSTDQAHLGPYGTTAQPLNASSAPMGTSTQNHTHTEQVIPNGAKVIEESTTTTTHSQRTVPRI